MSGEHRGARCILLLKGLLTAIMVTVVGMMMLALLVVYAHLSDNALLSLNQTLKLIAIFIGTWKAVGRGGRNGFVLGAIIGLVYAALGYGLCAPWEGMSVTGVLLAVEFLMGALIGGVSGALIANLPARSRSAKGTRGRRRAA